MASLLAKIGAFIAATSTVGCVLYFLVDEPEMPKSLIEK